MLPIITSLIPGLFDIIKSIFPNPEDQAKAQLQTMTMLSQLDTAQLEVNKVEAASDNVFVSGWRPALGWLCVFAYAFTYVISPFLNYYLVSKGLPVMPQLDQAQLDGVLYGMLGLGTLRSVEHVSKTLKQK